MEGFRVTYTQLRDMAVEWLMMPKMELWEAMRRESLPNHVRDMNWFKEARSIVINARDSKLWKILE